MDGTKLLKSTLAIALLASSTAYALKSGQLVVINGLGMASASSGNAGSTASSIKVVISDGTGACSTTNTVAYGGTVVMKWVSTATHSTTVCNSRPSTVVVTPLTTTVGGVTTAVYSNTRVTALPLTSPTATTFTAPTTDYANLVLLVTGSTSSATSTVWSFHAGNPPDFDTTNGGLVATGITGASVLYTNLKAEKVMRQYGILPHPTGR